MDKAKSAHPKILDLRGLACPEPVLRTKKLLDDQTIQHIEILVSDEINRQNLERLAKSHKLDFNWQVSGDFFRIHIKRKEASNQKNDRRAQKTVKAKNHIHINRSIAIAGQNIEPLRTATVNQVGTVVFINKDTFGDGEPNFSKNLLNIFLQSLLQLGHRPKAILLANSGVKLLAQNSPFQEVLKSFTSQGCEVLACGLCVEFYGLEKIVAKEQITNMLAICEYLCAAEKIICP